MRILVIDAGNTSTGVGVYQNGGVIDRAHVRGGIRMNPLQCSQAVIKAGRDGVDRAVLGSVVPRINQRWLALIQRELGLETMVVDASSPMCITVDYARPEEIGADRLADACGGVARYGAPLIVADFGTALTFDVIMPDKRYVGGVITPGIPLMTDYLYERAELLPRVELKGDCPDVGRSTKEAMRVGAEVGYRGIVREITTHLRQALNVDFKLVATGGYATWALRDLDMDYKIDQDLTLFGLGCICENAL